MAHHPDGRVAHDAPDGGVGLQVFESGHLAPSSYARTAGDGESVRSPLGASASCSRRPIPRRIGKAKPFDGPRTAHADDPGSRISSCSESPFSQPAWRSTAAMASSIYRAPAMVTPAPVRPPPRGEALAVWIRRCPRRCGGPPPHGVPPVVREGLSCRKGGDELGGLLDVIEVLLGLTPHRAPPWSAPQPRGNTGS